MLRIAYLGPEGTVSHESAAWFFAGEDVELIPFRVISDVFLATAHGKTDASVVPIENTIDGSVNAHMDFLVHEVDMPILAEWTYPSVQNLIGFSADQGGDDLSRIRRVISIPVAIAQCHTFLRTHLPEAEYEHVPSTAEGVRLVKERGDHGLAAIGTASAANMYGLDLLKKDIGEHQNNLTRFIIVGNKPIPLKPSPKCKTSIIVAQPEDYPGGLHQVLSAFAWRRINLSKIESRPTKKRLGSYYFYIDVEASMDSVLLPAAIAEIEAIGCRVRLMGSYPSYSYDIINSEVQD
ncbi:MAG TPA: prephenate dehydratase [Bacilli bacterium]